jgi:hypothetical protein
MQLAMGKFVMDGRLREKGEAVTDLPSTKDSTSACFPAQHVSANESKPSLQPSLSSSGDNVIGRGVSI